MCNNRNYSKEESKRIDKMSKYAVAILQGKSLELVAEEDGVTVEVVKEHLEDIKNINPYLYHQVKEILKI